MLQAPATRAGSALLGAVAVLVLLVLLGPAAAAGDGSGRPPSSAPVTGTVPSAGPTVPDERAPEVDGPPSRTPAPAPVLSSSRTAAPSPPASPPPSRPRSPAPSDAPGAVTARPAVPSASSEPAVVRGREPTAPAIRGSSIPVGSVVLAGLVLLGAGALVRQALGHARQPRLDQPLAGPPAPAGTTLAFLLALAEALVDAGDALQHVTTTVREIGAVLGVADVGVVVLPTAVFLSVPAPGGVGVVSDVTSAGANPLRLDQADALFRVVDEARDGRLTPEEGLAEVRRVRAVPAPFSPGVRVLGYVLFSTGLSLLLRGSTVDVALAGALGVAVGALHLVATRWERNVQALLPVLAALVVSVVVFSVGSAVPELAVLPSLVAPLVVLLPGALLTTAVFELSTGDIVAGAGRLAAGGLRLVLLALGILAGAQLVGVPASRIAGPPGDALGTAAPWLGVTVFAVGVVLFVGARWSSLPWILLVLHVAYAGQVLGGLVFGAALSAFFGALAMTPVAVVAARARSGPPALVSFSPGFWLLVPGAVGLEGVTRFLDEDRVEGITSLVTMGTSLVGIAIGVLLGLAVGSTVTRRLPA